MNTNKLVQHLRNPNPELWKEIKVICVTNEVTMTEWVEDACRQKLAKDKSKKSK